MNSGALRQLVTLDRGEPATPLDPPTWHCAALDQGGGLVLFSGRFHKGISTDTRVHWNGRTYHVDSVANRTGRDTELVLNCREVFD